jgi:hypothetical protein
MLIRTLRLGALTAVMLAGSCSAARAQSWSIGGLTCYLNNLLTGAQYPINTCSTQIGGFTFQWLFSGGALCTNSCNPNQTGFYPEASLEAYAGISLPCPNEVWVTFTGKYGTNPSTRAPGVAISAQGTVAGHPGWDLTSIAWQDCNGVSFNTGSEEETCGTYYWELL